MLGMLQADLVDVCCSEADSDPQNKARANKQAALLQSSFVLPANVSVEAN